MAVYTDGQIIATVHDFKTHISKYIRMLERGEYRAVIVRRYEKQIGVFLTHHSHERWEERQKLLQELAADDFNAPEGAREQAAPDA